MFLPVYYPKFRKLNCQSFRFVASVTAPPANGTIYRFIPKKVAASIGEIDITSSINIYPTVTSTILNIEYKSSDIVTAEILNLNGQIICSSTLKNGSNQIDVSTFPSNQYLIRIVNSEGNAAYKFIKK